MSTFDQTAAIAAVANLLSGLVVELERKGVLAREDIVQLLQRTNAKSSADPRSAEITALLRTLFPNTPIG